MIITVDSTSAVPPYEQIRQQIRLMIAHGTLTSGQRLPTIAQLANDLGLATGTVARAYRELEADGLVRSARRTGTFITDEHAKAPSKARASDVDAVVAEFVLRLRQLGADPDRALNTARKMIDRTT